MSVFIFLWKVLCTIIITIGFVNILEIMVIKRVVNEAEEIDGRSKKEEDILQEILSKISSKEISDAEFINCYTLSNSSINLRQDVAVVLQNFRKWPQKAFLVRGFFGDIGHLRQLFSNKNK